MLNLFSSMIQKTWCSLELSVLQDIKKNVEICE